MNEARIRFIPAEPPSVLGYNVDGPSVNPEMDGAMVTISFVTANHGKIAITCTHAWADALADHLKKRVRECRAHCKAEGVIPVEAKP